ncbi:MAG: hypothetical protein IPO44_04595 [Candidatus Microthrix sp.]|nr:DUF6325 family protein [Candidatus Microthrix sp.]MBK9558857.1 hypothetical protein [Candidatus Microthrix sp.]
MARDYELETDNLSEHFGAGTTWGVNMGFGPIEVIVVVFEGNEFTGEILPELRRLVDAGTVTVIDGVFIRKDADGSVTHEGLEGLSDDEGAKSLVDVLKRAGALVSDDDVADLANDMTPNTSAALLAFEHTWAKPFTQAIVSSGGELRADVRVPGSVADAVLAASDLDG